MMSLATLWAVVKTLDAKRTSPIATSIARAWGGDFVPVYVRGSANFVFRVDGDTGARFLRFAHESERTHAAIEQEMELLCWLRDAGVRVNEPIETAEGELVATVDTDLGRFHAVLLTGVAGEHLDIENLDLPMFAQWGKGVGGLHAQFDRMPDRLRRPPAWRETLAAAAEAGELLARESGLLGAALAELPSDPGAFGPIHTDLELDNLLWNGKDFGFIDFDENTAGWRAFDVAKALSELEATPGDPRMAAFVSGYREQHPLPDESLAALPLMSRLFDLGMYLRLQRALSAPLDPAGTETFARLIVNLSGWMERYETRTASRLNG